jgi:outer membrane lipoprotein carrier protein
MKIISIIFLFLSTLSSQELTPTEILEKIRLHYSQMNDASASFIQLTTIRYKKGAQQSSGTIKIKKGNKYRIETDKQTIVTDGKTVWMFNSISKQVLRDTYKQNRQPFSPDKFLLGLPKEFSAVNVARDSQYYVLSLTPSAAGATVSMFSFLKVWIRPEIWEFEKIEITDKNNSITTITLSNIIFNKGMSDTVFQFMITDDMKLVDLTKIQ